MAVSVFILFFYALTFITNDRPLFGETLTVGALPALLAVITFAVAVTSSMLTSKRPEAHLPLITQCLMIAAVATLIFTTGGIFSYFIVLWVPAIIFMGVFGSPALIAAMALPILYALWFFITGILTPHMAITLLMVGEIPVVLSSLLFSHLATQKEDSSYRQLATQFSQVSDKAEVVINAITNGVIAIDRQGVIELMNPEAQRLIGWESRDALKLDYRSVLKLLDKESNELTAANDPIQNALTTNKETRTEDLKLVTNSGKKLLVSLVVSPVGQQGSGVIIVFRDITKEKTEEREQAEFISTASHEMRTPVASIEGYLGLALNPATAQIDDKARSYITKAHEVAQHLGRLFQDLLDVTKAEDGRLSNNPRAVEVVTFVQDIVEGLRPQAEAKGLILHYKPIPEEAETDKSNRRLNPVFYANVDNDHLREVVANLVENAIKYTKKGSVSIDIGGNDKEVKISIEDTGIGIPNEDLPHLFQKFYRVDNSDTREIGGTGLGLYLSRRLVEAMEGRVWAESRHGDGSTFFVSIPRISHQEAMELIETSNAAPPEIAPAINGVPLFSPDSVTQSPSPLMEVPQQPVAYSAQVIPSISEPTQPTPQPAASPTLSAIEQNPGQYLSRTPSLSVPPRTAQAPSENQNQP